MFNRKGGRYTLKRNGNSQKNRRKTRRILTEAEKESSSRKLKKKKKKTFSPLKDQVRINWKIFFGFDKKGNNWRPKPGNAKDQEQ